MREYRLSIPWKFVFRVCLVVNFLSLVDNAFHRDPKLSIVNGIVVAWALIEKHTSG